MKNSIWITPLVAALAVPTLLAACGENVDLAPAEAPEASSLSATVGPAGGVLEGTAGSAFEGVRLEVPAGALATATTVRITTTLDETPLPEHAERVGTQFRIEPEGVALRAPAHLTLPVTEGIVQRFGQMPGDVRVWVRDGAGWALRQPTATAAGAVTIDVGALTTAAAGVVLNLHQSICDANCIRAAIGTCSGGFCAAPLRVTVRPSQFSPLVHDSNGSAYYLHVNAAPASSLTSVRINPANGASVESTPLARATPEIFSTMTADLDGSVWAFVSNVGTVHFRYGSSTDVYDPGLPGAFHGRGAVFGGTRLVRLESEGFVARFPDGTAGPFLSPVAWPSQLADLGTGALAATDPVTPNRFWIASPHGSSVFQVDASARLSSQAVVASSALPSGQTALALGAMSIAPRSQRLAVQTFPGPRLVIIPQGGQAFMPNGVPALYGFDYDRRDDSLWMSLLDTPEVWRMDATNQITRISLTTAAPGTAGFGDSLPRAIHAMPDGSVLVVTRGGGLLKITRSN